MRVNRTQIVLAMFQFQALPVRLNIRDFTGNY